MHCSWTDASRQANACLVLLKLVETSCLQYHVLLYFYHRREPCGEQQRTTCDIESTQECGTPLYLELV